jgi:hypothetical protein
MISSSELRMSWRAAPPRVCRAALGCAGVVVVLLVWALMARGQPWIIRGPLWDLQDTRHLKWMVVDCAWRATLEVGLFAMLAGCAHTASFLVPRNWSPLRRMITTVAAVSAVAGCASMIQNGFAGPSILDLVLPLGGAIPATWLARERTRAVPMWHWWAKVGGVVSAGVIGAVALAALATESDSLPFEPAVVASDQRVHLARKIRSRSPRTISDGQTVTLKLSQDEVDVLLAWGLSLGSADRKARLRLEDKHATLSASIRLPWTQRYLNVVVSGHAEVHGGAFDMDVTSCRIGRVSLPRVILWAMSPGVADKVRSDPRIIPVLKQIESTRIGEGVIAGTYGRIEMPEGFREDIFGTVGSDEEFYAALDAQLRHIGALGRAAQDRSTGFERLLRGAFQLAHERSSESDPIVQNRAALIALGVTQGHGMVGEVLGRFPHDAMPPSDLRLYAQTPLRGRVDWSRHFFVSAALAVVANESVSYDVGVLKEEIDAGTPGGSGFSFADLAADRAGITLGVVATKSEWSAREVQDRLRDEFSPADLFPEVADLPEGLTQARVEDEYGGPNGQGYANLLDEIDRRIMECSFYQ